MVGAGRFGDVFTLLTSSALQMKHKGTLETALHYLEDDFHSLEHDLAAYMMLSETGQKFFLTLAQRSRRYKGNLEQFFFYDTHTYTLSTSIGIIFEFGEAALVAKRLDSDVEEVPGCT